MSATHSPHPVPSSSGSRTRGATARMADSDWISTSILTAKIIAAGAECLPFPYVKGVFGTTVILLETVQNVKKNRDDLKDLCGNTIDIITIIQCQISSHGDTAAVRFKDLCEEFEGCLRDVLIAVNKLQEEPRGFWGHLKRFLTSSRMQDEITGHKNKVQKLQSNFMLIAAMDTNFQVHKVLTVISPDNVGVARITQSSNNCPPPSRIFHGRQAILEQMHQYFISDHPTRQLMQYIFLLYGLGGGGKTQIALRFIEWTSSRFSDIFLVDASTIGTIDMGLKNIAISKKIGTTSQDALQWLRSTHNGWLLFLDNADDPKINLNNFFPQCNHGNILITSRNPGLCALSQKSDLGYKGFIDGL
ncbi:hypothetical protein B0H16DRAFT_1528461 [Mycena metata]|uniref:NB-ARC domain-containing protein n=1 Tax=Mycena metata TaxID=1033252 RepID=A0AAD7JI49_9AGAR|nr:hypothetical protein B0H16DRAFT_1528461 [Mycena metata]